MLEHIKQLTPPELIGGTICLVIIWLFALALARGVSGLFTTPKDVESLDDHAEFHAAKSVVSRVRIDPLTGEGYSHKLTRIPADIPMSDKAPTIIDPIQRKVKA